MKYVLGDKINRNLLFKNMGAIVKTNRLSQKLMGKIIFFLKKNHQHHIYVNVLSDFQIK